MVVLDSIIVAGGGSLVLGGVTGYALKKIAKLAAIVVGLFIAALAFLEYKGIVTVNWNTATSTAENATQYVYQQIIGVAHHAAGHINMIAGVAGGGFMAGFMIGFWRG